MDQDKMKTTHKKTSENFKIIGYGNNQPKQLKEKLPQPTYGNLTFETGKEHDLFKRIEDGPDYLHEEVINIITQGKPRNV
jgi:hypothetical protein